MATVFSYKTRGNSSPKNKPKVYFACHPEDFDRYFEDICKDIHEANDCVIFYTEDMNSSLTDENTLVDLERMSLFVIPVSFRLLSTPNRAMDFDYRFAREKNIPVLPLMMESGLYEFYKKPEKFGELQYLRPNSTDLTAIDYKDKLKKYLESVLISDELAQRIRKAFDAYIFLSYRKKDRKHANELMKLIHKNPECEDIAIWFDEFLTPGESFRENIERILNDSRLFTLLVTPSLLERQPDGTPNFIMRVEYPKAKQLSKRILPAEMVETDKEALRRDYKDIPECTDTKDEEAFNRRLTNSLIGIAISENNDEPEHNYLIGLAYLKGIDVEIDIDRGVRLITKAAEAGFRDAVYKLYKMYRDGDNVKLDYNNSLYWANRLYEILSDRSGEEHPDTIDALFYLADTYDLLGNYKTAFELYEKCYELNCKIRGKEHPDSLTLLCNLAGSYEALGNYEKALELLGKCYEIRCRVIGNDHLATLITLNNYADAYRKLGRYKEAITLFETCYASMCSVLGETHRITLGSLNDLAVAYELCGNYKKALELLNKCYEKRCGILGEDHPDTLGSLSNLAAVYNSSGNYKKAFELNGICYRERCRVLGEEHPETLKSLNNLACVCDSLGDSKKAVELHQKCYEIRCRVLEAGHPETLKTICNLANAYHSLGENEKAVTLHEKCYEMRCGILGKEHPDTLVSLHGLADDYDSLGEHEKALELNEKCYETGCRVLGDKHPDTLVFLNALAGSYYKTGNNEKAVELIKKCYESECVVLGEEHPRTLNALRNVAVAYSSVGDYKKAIDSYEKCYGIRCRVLGEEHPGTLALLLDISGCYKKLGENEKAQEIMTAFYSKARKTSGKDQTDDRPAVQQNKSLSQKTNDKETAEYIKSKIIIAQKKHRYEKLRFCQSDDPEAKDALAQYASGAKPEDVIAIDNRTKKLFGKGKAKGILLTRNAIYSSLFEGNKPIYYKDIKHAALSVEGIRFRLKNGESIDCDFGQANDFILGFLTEIGIG